MSWKRPYNNKDIRKSLSWVSAWKPNEGILIDAVAVATEKEVRVAALKKVTDIYWLKKIFADERADYDTKARVLLSMIMCGRGQGRPVSYEESMQVVSQVTDPDVFREMARYCHRESFKKITDQQTLVSIISGTANFFLGNALYDETCYNAHFAGAFIEMDCKEECVSLILDRITNEGLYFNLFVNTPYKSASKYYIRKLIDGGWINSAVFITDASLKEEKRRELLGFVDDNEVLDAFAEDMDNPKDLRMSAVYRITDTEKRKKYCEKYGTHQFEFVESRKESVGDRAYITNYYRCVYCGAYRTDDETYVY